LSLFPKRLPTRRKFLQISAAGVAAAGVAVAGDGTFIEANRPQLVSIEVPLSRLDEVWDGFRIAQLSDFHYDDYFSVVPLRKGIDMIHSLQPDIIVLTGDFVTSPLRDSGGTRAQAIAEVIEPCALLLSQLRAPSGVLASLGNHDLDTNAAQIIDVLQAHAIPVLRNRSVVIERAGKRLWFAGVDDVLEGKPDLQLALHGVPASDPVVLLSHEPDWADYVAGHPVDLQLSGHSHGGQIRLPFLGATYLPDLGRKYPWGLRRIQSLYLYTNCGIGTIRIPMRLNCPPEVTLITLRAGKSVL
jgi:uncharacterized protein